MRYFALFAILSLLPVAAAAQPFGISMGQQLDPDMIVKKLDEFRFIIHPTKNHAEFEKVMIITTPLTGACLVKGIGINHSDDAYGYEILRVFDEIRLQIDSSYGSSSLDTFLLSGSIWRRPGDWATSIKVNERVHQAIWKSGSKPLLNNAQEILLQSMHYQEIPLISAFNSALAIFKHVTPK